MIKRTTNENSDVYPDAAAHNVTTVGVSVQTVGAAGGYFTGGGHTPIAHFYGLVADNLLKVNIFIKVEGGSAWGVVTSTTYKTHHLPTHIQVVAVQANVTNRDALRTVYKTGLAAIPGITNAGYVEYGDLTGSFQAIFNQENGTDGILAAVLALFVELAKVEGVTAAVFPLPHFPTCLDHSAFYLQDPNIATVIIDASRLLTAVVLISKTDESIDLIFGNPENGPGFNIIEVNPVERENIAVHPVWANSQALLSFGADRPDEAPAAENKRKKQQLAEISKKLGAVAGKDGLMSTKQLGMNQIDRTSSEAKDIFDY